MSLETAVAPSAPSIITEPPIPTSRELRKMEQESDEAELRAFLEEFSAGQPVELRLERKKPEIWLGKNIYGHAKTYNEVIGVEDIKAEFGGGKYELKISLPNAKGHMGFRKTRVINIAGDPILPVSTTPPVTAPTGDTGTKLAEKAFETMASTLKSAQDNLEEERRRPPAPGIDNKLIDVLRDQAKAAEDRATKLEERINAIMSAKPDHSSTDRLVDKLIDGDTARIEAIRTQHASELREVRETQKGDIGRLHDAYTAQIAATERSHQREIDNLIKTHDNTVASMKSAHENTLAALKSSHETAMMTTKSSLELRIEGLKSDVARLERELTKQDAELGALRAVKDKSIIDQAKDLAAVGEALKVVGIGGEEKEEQSTFDKIVQSDWAKEVGIGIASRIKGPDPAAQAQAAAAAQQAAQAQAIANMPINQPMRLPNGVVIMKQANGQVVQVTQQRRRRQQAQGSQAQDQPAEPEVTIDPAILAQAVSFIENAINQGAEPEVFAESARAMVPKSLVAMLQVKGVDHFYTVAGVKDDSPLNTQRGKNFIRKVVAVLAGAK